MRRLPLLLAAVLLTVGGFHIGSAAASEAGDTMVKVLVHVDGSSPAATDRVLHDLAAAGTEPRSVDRYESIPWLAVDVPQRAVDVLNRSDAVTAVLPDRVHHVALDQTVPLIHADTTTADGYDGTGTSVAVLDTGVETSHPFLAGKTVAEACFSILGSCRSGRTSDSGTGSAAPCTYDATDCKHGTHVAGIAVGRRSSGSGGPAQGVAPGADLVAIQVFSDDRGVAGAYDSDILAGLDWVRTHASAYNIASVNLSLGDSGLFGVCDGVTGASAYASLFTQLRSAGVAPVVASGNDGATGAMNFPACLSTAISVAASTDADAMASYSNAPSFTSIVAPGSSVTSSVPGGGYATLSGTSMATPHVAGAFAVMKQAAPASGVDAVLTAFRASGRRVSGLPRLDLLDALTRLVPAPGPPANVVATPGAQSADLSWSVPQWRRVDVTGYRVTGPGTITVSGATAHVAGLTAGVAATFSVAAVSAAGTGTAVTVATTPTGALSSGGGGGGGGGGGTTTPPPSTTQVPSVAPPAAPPAPSLSAVPVNGGVLVLRNGVPTTLDAAPPAFAPPAAAAATPTGRGAWVASPDGRVAASGDAPDLGGLNIRLNQPIVGMAATQTGRGFWLMGADGGIFSFGDARFFGSTGSMRLNQPIVSMGATPTGNGYWLMGADGGIFSFGDARFFGSTGGMRLVRPVVGMAVTATGNGYWLVAGDGGVFTFGDASFKGAGGQGHGISAIAPAPSGRGYWLLSNDGAALPYGDVNP